ncbi:MAG: hypothetical protein AB9835_10330 [Eubacteriales bacterium]
MSKQNTKIKDAFNKFLAGDVLKNALNLVEFLSENDMVYDGEYEIHYKGKLACYINMPSAEDHIWGVWTVGDYSTEYKGFPIDEHTKEIAWSNVVKCGNCGGTRDGVGCNPGKTEVIFGKEFANVCNGTDNLAMRFINPDAKALECAKKMVEMTKYTIDNRT